MAHRLRRGARRHEALRTTGLSVAAVALAGLALLLVLAQRVEVLDRLGLDPAGFAMADRGDPAAATPRWSLGPGSHGSAHVILPDVRSAAEQAARPASDPGPLLAATTIAVSAVALGWTTLARARRSYRRREEVGGFRRRGPPSGATAPTPHPHGV